MTHSTLKPPPLARRPPTERPFGRSRGLASLREPGYGLTHAVVAALLAAYPWAYAFELVGQDVRLWSVWIGLVTVQAVALLIRPTRNRLLPVATLALVLGLGAVQAMIIIERIVTGQLNIDYFVLARWISAASQDLLAPVPNASSTASSYFQYYFDPLVPLLNRLFGLTEDPFRLLGFQTLAVISPAVLLWGLSLRGRLAAFQALLPSAFLLHPALVANLQQDYHASGIGMSLLLLGCYTFFHDRRILSYVLLLLGALTKVSFWLPWFLFALVHLKQRRFGWTAVYVGTAVGALLVYRLIQPPQQAASSLIAAMYFGNLGSTPAEVLGNLVARSGEMAWIAASRLSFFWNMSIPFGLSFLLFPAGLLPLLPLAFLSLVEQTGYRSLIYHQYAAEYLGFLLAATLLGLESARPRWRMALAVAIGVGALVSVNFLLLWGRPTVAYEPRLRQSFRTAVGATPDYRRAVEFSRCATGGRPVLVTLSQRELYAWTTFAREPLSAVWIDQMPTGLAMIDAAFPAIDQTRWDSFETLVYAADPNAAGSLAAFPRTTGLRYAPDYARLLERLPVGVTIGQGWRYRGTDRLAACAQQFGYGEAATVEPLATVSTAEGAALYARVHGLPFTPPPERIPLLERFPCQAEVDRLGWWFDRPEVVARAPGALEAMQRLTLDLPDKRPPRCFAEVEAVLGAIELDWRADHLPPAGAPCTADLDLATTYYDRVFDEPLRAANRADLDRAVAARQAGDDGACLQAAAAVRRAYLSALRTPTVEPPATAEPPAMVAPPAAVEPPLATEPPATVEAGGLLSRFPCRAEATRIGWWFDRPELVARGPRTPPAVQRLLADLDGKDPVHCRAEVETALQGFDLDWRPDHPPPAGASCEADLALAGTYYDKVFDDTLRTEVWPAHQRAVAARQADDQVACLMAAAEVRRAYVRAVPR